MLLPAVDIVHEREKKTSPIATPGLIQNSESVDIAVALPTRAAQRVSFCGWGIAEKDTFTEVSAAL